MIADNAVVARKDRAKISQMILCAGKYFCSEPYFSQIFLQSQLEASLFFVNKTGRSINTFDGEKKMAENESATTFINVDSGIHAAVHKFQAYHLPAASVVLTGPALPLNIAAGDVVFLHLLNKNVNIITH